MLVCFETVLTDCYEARQFGEHVQKKKKIIQRKHGSTTLPCEASASWEGTLLILLEKEALK